MPVLAPDQRRKLRAAISEARVAGEAGAHQALDALAVAEPRPHPDMAPDKALLRNRLRAHGRQLGDPLEPEGQARGRQGIARLVRELAYQHWHRMLFARFLAENHLLIEPESGVAVTLAECEELAQEEGKDTYVLAAGFAERMLPQIFRVDDPSLALDLPPEVRQKLSRLVAELPLDVFLASDALGWTYQYWQAAEKKTVDARVRSGAKITGETLPPVTQLFTEPYMVSFLLHNTLGAWHADRVLARCPELAQKAASEAALRDAVRLGGGADYDFPYLRFVREPIADSGKGGEREPAHGEGPWRPAAGGFPGWPETAAGITVLDPCCGSGHFLVAAFELLVALRQEEEGLELVEAIRAVLRDNLAGIELDPRCTQIAAFHLAFAAWKLAGRPIELPPLRVACSGLGPQASREKWLELADRESAAWEAVPDERRDAVRNGLVALHETFSEAPELGSLIDPRERRQDLFTAEYTELRPFLEAAYQAEADDIEGQERAVAARGMAEAAELLATEHYTLILTNVPYLGRNNQGDVLRTWIDARYEDASNDLATVFVERMLRWGGTVAAVTPQNWLFQYEYRGFREGLLRSRTIHFIARLGFRAFQTPQWDFGTSLSITDWRPPDERHEIQDLILPLQSPTREKADLLRMLGPVPYAQASQLSTRDYVISCVETRSNEATVGRVCECSEGSKPGQTARVTLQHWEILLPSESWTYLSSSPTGSTPFSGNAKAIWSPNRFETREIPEAGVRSLPVWGKHGVILQKIGRLPAALYMGGVYDNNCFGIVPKNPGECPALWCFVSSPEFLQVARSLNQKNDISLGAVASVPFDLAHWQKVAAERYPNGLPEPQSDDPSQWLFHGHPAHAEPGTALQVVVARLLGYRWPAEHDPSMRLAPEARAKVAACGALARFADADGIVGIPAMRGEASASDRLTALLSAAFIDLPGGWSAAREQDLLAAAVAGGKTKPAHSLDEWLREQFFEQHCALFHSRPFVWHVWDGRKDGFQALVNYHKLAGPDGQGRRTLEALTYSYLGEWIDRQRAELRSDDPDVKQGAEARLAAALALKDRLEAILAGEPPCDLFVRWKPLHQQPLGWDPDLDDGVRLNMRPFLLVGDVKAKGAGILRVAPDKTWANKKKPGVADRGKEPESLRPRQDFPWFYGANPETHPDHVVDFGASTPGSAPSGAFDGIRWNGLHYTRSAKEHARKRRGREQ